MKICLPILIISICLSQVNCATFYKLFPEKSTFYSKQEMEILDKTTKAIEFDHGFDPELNLEYVFPQHGEYADINVKKKNFSKMLQGIERDSLVAYCEKIYRLKKLTHYKMGRYNEKKEWKNYTFIKKYLLPPLDNYYNLLEEQVFLKNDSNKKVYYKRKRAIDKEIDDEIKRLNFEEIWENEYDS